MISLKWRDESKRATKLGKASPLLLTFLVLGLCSIVLLAAVAGSRFTSDVVKADSQVTSDVVIWPSLMSLPFTYDNLRSSLYFELLSGLSTVHFFSFRI
jgi:hypothetical protein